MLQFMLTVKWMLHWKCRISGAGNPQGYVFCVPEVSSFLPVFYLLDNTNLLFPLVFPVFIQSTQFFHVFASEWDFLSSLSRLAKLLLGTLSSAETSPPWLLHIMCKQTSAQLFGGFFFWCLSFSNIIEKVKTNLTSVWSHVCCSASHCCELCNTTPISFSAHLSKIPPLAAFLNPFRTFFTACGCDHVGFEVWAQTVLLLFVGFTLKYCNEDYFLFRDNDKDWFCYSNLLHLR